MCKKGPPRKKGVPKLPQQKVEERVKKGLKGLPTINPNGEYGRKFPPKGEKFKKKGKRRTQYIKKQWGEGLKLLLVDPEILEWGAKVLNSENMEEIG